jgi:phosphoribosylaminoimidazole-succinocarboxamide synthase
MLETLYESTVKSLPLVARGKVRDVYAVGDDHLLMVTTDRLSAFDVILPDPIPGKGAVLTAVSNFWFKQTQDIIPNHLSDLTLADVLPDESERAEVEGRAVVTKKLKALPVEAIVRGYLIGSGWVDYKQTGHVCGIALPAGLQLADKLPEAIFTVALRYLPVCSWPTSCRKLYLRRPPRPLSVITTRTLISKQPGSCWVMHWPSRCVISA